MTLHDALSEIRARHEAAGTNPLHAEVEMEIAEIDIDLLPGFHAAVVGLYAPEPIDPLHPFPFAVALAE